MTLNSSYPPSGTSEIQAALARFIRFGATAKYLDTPFRWLGGVTAREYAAKYGIDELTARVDEVDEEIRGGYRG